MRWLVGLMKSKIVLFILVFGAFFTLGALVGGKFSPQQSIETSASQGKTVNILFLGIDARDTKSNSRSDTIILASINTKTKKIALISIPRDTRIKNSFGRSDKINSVNYLKGPEAACKEVGELLDTRVDYYVVTNFAGFSKIVDVLGGVHINVEHNMYHADPVNPELAINIHKGYQYLDGKTALAFVRYRGGPTADIGRTQRQQQFIKALAKEMIQAKTILKLPKLLPVISENIRTNIPFKDMLYLAHSAKDFEDPGAIVTQTLPGYPYTDPSTGVSYWEVDRDIASTIIEDLLNGKKFDIVSDPPDWLEKEPAKVVPQQEVIEEIIKEQEEIEELEEAEEAEEANETGNGTSATEPSDNTPDDPADPEDPQGQTPDPGNTGGTGGETPEDQPPGSDPVVPPITSDPEETPPGDNIITPVIPGGI
ncbi:MAG: LCP family protein [Syntrophomonadaceae bacterium]|jgi:LCP family protein required for cell wall assembly